MRSIELKLFLISSLLLLISCTSKTTFHSQKEIDNAVNSFVNCLSLKPKKEPGKKICNAIISSYRVLEENLVACLRKKKNKTMESIFDEKGEFYSYHIYMNCNVDNIIQVEVMKDTGSTHLFLSSIGIMM